MSANEFDLPSLGGHKSFYGKAKVKEYSSINGIQVRELTSYSTVVCVLENLSDFYRTWEGYSATTLRHVNSFRALYGLKYLSKKDWEGLDVHHGKY